MPASNTLGTFCSKSTLTQQSCSSPSSKLQFPRPSTPPFARPVNPTPITITTASSPHLRSSAASIFKGTDLHLRTSRHQHLGNTLRCLDTFSSRSGGCSRSLRSFLHWACLYVEIPVCNLPPEAYTDPLQAYFVSVNQKANRLSPASIL